MRGPGSARPAAGPVPRRLVRALAGAAAASLLCAGLAAPAGGARQDTVGAGRETAGAPDGTVGARPAGRVTVRLLTIGPGDRVWEKFGHNALWIHDPDSGRDVVYNWGIFDFAQEDFFVRLLTGRMRYRVARTSLERSLRFYRAADRTIRVQELRLTASEAREVARRARINHLPENRHYAYDPFRDNCSTRIRDLLDRVLDGRVRDRTDGVETGTTYRSHTRRLLQRVEWAYLGIMAFLGAPTDRRLSAWDEMFLPVRMDDRLRDVRVRPGGDRPVPLASAPRTLHRAERAPVPERTPGLRLGYLGGGVAGGALLAALGLLGGRDRRAAARGFRVLAALWSAAAGAAGVVALGGWAFTGHWYVHLNENVLQLQPLSLVLAAALPLSGRSDRARWLARRAAGITAALAVLGAALQALPGLDQVNGDVLSLALPLHVGLAFGIEALARPRA